MPKKMVFTNNISKTKQQPPPPAFIACSQEHALRTHV